MSPTASELRSVRPAPPAGGLLVAVVDDDELARRLTRDVLRARGHRVELFDDAARALEALAAPEAGYEVVISDLRMPGLGGDALCQALRARLGLLCPPVVVVSGAQDEEEVGRALDAGARHYVRKPFSPGELAAIVERAARRGGAQLREGGRVGPYRLGAELGRGAMGVVYRARRAGAAGEEGPEVALKVLRWSGAEVEDQLRFRRELDLLAAVDHPGVAGLLEAGQEGELVYYAMELVEGESLARALRRRGALPAREVARIGWCVASTLAALHERAILHRDVKPDNLIVTPHGVARLVDFGLARRPHDLALTRPEWLLGTPLYMAPELLEEGGPNPASDVFALGITLFQALAGAHPLAERAGNLLAVATAYRAGGLPPLRDQAPGTPADLVALVERCLDPDPAARPAAAELALGLRRALVVIVKYEEEA
ncbi:MAG: protein kinase [Planctomycetota bacterium]